MQQSCNVYGSFSILYSIQSGKVPKKKILYTLLKKGVTAFMIKNALVVPHAYNWTFTIRPNDLREDRLSRDITESVHALVARR